MPYIDTCKSISFDTEFVCCKFMGCFFWVFCGKMVTIFDVLAFFHLSATIWANPRCPTTCRPACQPGMLRVQCELVRAASCVRCFHFFPMTSLLEFFLQPQKPKTFLFPVKQGFGTRQIMNHPTNPCVGCIPCSMMPVKYTRPCDRGRHEAGSSGTTHPSYRGTAGCWWMKFDGFIEI